MKKYLLGKNFRSALVLLVVFFSFSGEYFCQANRINNFTNLYSALLNGQNVRVIINYSKCKLVIDGKEEKAPEAIGGMELKSFEYFAKGAVKNEKAFIVSSETVLISHSYYGYVYNYIKIRIYDDDSVEIIARYLDPIDFSIKMDETFGASLGNNGESGAVNFYTN